MERINLEQKLSNLEYDQREKVAIDLVYKLFADLKMEKRAQKKDYVKMSDEEKQALLESKQREVRREILVDINTVDPRLRWIEVYCTLSKKEADMLIELYEGASKVEKGVKNIDGLSNHKSMKFDYIKIDIDEYCYAFKGGVVINIVLEENDGASYVPIILKLEQDLALAKSRLDYYDVKF